MRNGTLDLLALVMLMAATLSSAQSSDPKYADLEAAMSVCKPETDRLCPNDVSLSDSLPFTRHFESQKQMSLCHSLVQQHIALWW